MFENSKTNIVRVTEVSRPIAISANIPFFVSFTGRKNDRKGSRFSDAKGLVYNVANSVATMKSTPAVPHLFHTVDTKRGDAHRDNDNSSDSMERSSYASKIHHRNNKRDRRSSSSSQNRYSRRKHSRRDRSHSRHRHRSRSPSTDRASKSSKSSRSTRDTFSKEKIYSRSHSHRSGERVRTRSRSRSHDSRSSYHRHR